MSSGVNNSLSAGSGHDPTVTQVDYPRYSATLYSEDFSRLVGDGLNDCSIQERKHFLECERQRVNFFLGLVCKAHKDNCANIKNKYQSTQDKNPTPDVKDSVRGSERLGIITADLIASFRFTQKLELLMKVDGDIDTTQKTKKCATGTTELKALPADSKQFGTATSRQMPVPERLVNMEMFHIVTNMRQEQHNQACSSPVEDNGRACPPMSPFGPCAGNSSIVNGVSRVTQSCADGYMEAEPDKPMQSPKAVPTAGAIPTAEQAEPGCDPFRNVYLQAVAYFGNNSSSPYASSCHSSSSHASICRNWELESEQEAAIFKATHVPADTSEQREGTLISLDDDDNYVDQRRPDELLPKSSEEARREYLEKLRRDEGMQTYDIGDTSLNRDKVDNTQPLDVGDASLNNEYGTRIIHESQPISELAARALPMTTPTPAGRYKMKRCPRFVPNEDFVDRLYDNEQDRQAAMKLHKDSQGHISSTFQYGVQYTPNIPAAMIMWEHRQRDYECSSVVISGLPRKIAYRYLMPLVRGGKILHIIIIDTTAFDTGDTAFVVFAEWRDAHAYVDFAKKNPACIRVQGKQARVSLAGTPTHPGLLKRDPIYGQSRLLQLGWFPRDRCHMIFEGVEECFLSVEDALEDAWIDGCEVVFMLFSRVEYAKRFHKFIHRRPQFEDKRGSLDYLDDPCEGSLDDLRAPASLARFASGQEYPSLLEEWMAIRKRGANRFAPRPMASDLQPVHPGYRITPLEIISSLATGQTIISTEQTVLVHNQGVPAGTNNHPGRDSSDPDHQIDRAPPTGQTETMDILAADPEPEEFDVKPQTWSIDIFMSEDELRQGFSSCSLEHYKRKYGYTEFKESREGWERDWPYVGQIRDRKPNMTEDRWISKLVLPRDKGPIQALCDRDDHSHVLKSELDKVIWEKPVQAIPLSEAKERYWPIYQDMKRSEAYRKSKDFADDQYPPDGMKWEDLPELVDGESWPKPEDGPDWRKDFFDLLAKYHPSSSE
ncbi:uncharacterized protein JN550_012999 [Neoarthrinium moseri]|uniref:uncharacterized protein n=1 Tax=Neoarthrinium moseri TaxID=1658444 RepID=UPI001FDDA4A9|nr:uncharacterized protein JN550_012999 [Neoarthrinium moseri]KAI1857859.1 hypothetical protein JN550_012999 [Neoarthrinium moseri]